GAQEEAVHDGPLEVPAAERRAQPELDEDDVAGRAPPIDLAAQIGKPGEDGTELPPHLVEAVHHRRERLNELRVGGEEVGEAVERRRGPEATEAFDERGGSVHGGFPSTACALTEVGRKRTAPWVMHTFELHGAQA